MAVSEEFLAEFTEQLRNMFAERLIYVGHFGLAPDQDEGGVAVVFDRFAPADMECFRNILINCGGNVKNVFACGCDELKKWSPMEASRLRISVRDFYGDITAMIPAYTGEDMKAFIKLKACDLYRTINCRCLVPSGRETAGELKQGYKTAFLIMQTVCFLETGKFPRTVTDSPTCSTDIDKRMLEIAVKLNSSSRVKYSVAYDTLFDWCRDIIKRY